MRVDFNKEQFVEEVRLLINDSYNNGIMAPIEKIVNHIIGKYNYTKVYESFYGSTIVKLYGNIIIELTVFVYMPDSNFTEHFILHINNMKCLEVVLIQPLKKKIY